MGFAIASECASRGAHVTLISGPTHLQAHQSNIFRIDVLSAEEMLNACMKVSPSADVIIMAAAVADYTPLAKKDKKIKKQEESLELTLINTKDILGELGKQKKKNQFLVGFALETHNELECAKAKLKKKNLDLIVLNSLNDAKAGFMHDTNKVTIIDNKNRVFTYPLKDKIEVASDIIDKIVEQIQ